MEYKNTTEPKIEDVQENTDAQRKGLITKKRLPIIMAAVMAITLVALYAASVISTTVFNAILLSMVGMASVLVLFLLVRDARQKKGVKKWIVLLVKLLLMMPLFALYLAAVINTQLFIILKAVLLATFITISITMLVMAKVKRKKEA